MSEQIISRLNGNSHLLEKKANLLLDPHEKTHPKRIPERRINYSANPKNGANAERINSVLMQRREDEPNSISTMDEDLFYLKRQIDGLETYDQVDIRIRF